MSQNNLRTAAQVCQHQYHFFEVQKKLTARVLQNPRKADAVLRPTARSQHSRRLAARFAEMSSPFAPPQDVHTWHFSDVTVSVRDVAIEGRADEGGALFDFRK